MRKKLGLWVAGSAAIILLGWGVTALVTGDGKSKDSAEVAAISFAKDPTYYTEKYRPQYHLSPETGNMSDPNGLVYFEGNIINSIKIAVNGAMRLVVI